MLRRVEMGAGVDLTHGGVRRWAHRGAYAPRRNIVSQAHAQKAPWEHETCLPPWAAQAVVEKAGKGTEYDCGVMIMVNKRSLCAVCAVIREH